MRGLRIGLKLKVENYTEASDGFSLILLHNKMVSSCRVSVRLSAQIFFLTN
jgi:hypothetical protein